MDLGQVAWHGCCTAVFDSGGSDVDTSDDESFDGVPLVAIAFNIAKGPNQINSERFHSFHSFEFI